MLYDVTVDQIRSWPLVDGWYVAPSGERIDLGAGARIGERASIDAGARIGERARIGADAIIGARASIGADARIGTRAWIGARAIIGERVNIDAGAQIGAGVTLNTSPPQSRRSDGYLFALYPHDGALRITAGCRDFTLDDARAHWTRTRGGTPLGDESLAIIDHLTRMWDIRTTYRQEN